MPPDLPAPPPPPRASALARRLHETVGSVLLGKSDAVALAVATVLAGGHLLVEDVPGVGKTLLAKALARATGASFGRVQGTADLLPSDLTGVTVFDQSTGRWDFRPGPLFHHVVLVDEINRATPRAQSALLEAMAEGQVTVDGVTHGLPEPFVVLATQNPLGDAGTFPLGDGQRDRFAVTLPLGLPDRATERALLLGVGGEGELDRLAPVTSPAELLAARDEVATIHVAAPVADYVLDLAASTRSHPEVLLGASPRATLVLLRVARGLAALAGRGFVTPDDVQTAAPAVLHHRITTHGRVPPAEVVDEVIARTRVRAG